MGCLLGKPRGTITGDWEFVPTARRFEIGGTSNYAGAIALGETLGLINEIGIDNIDKRVVEMSEYCMTGLEELGGTLITHRDIEHRSGLVIFRLYKDLEKDREVLKRLHSQRIFIAQRFTDNVGGFRVSCHYYNNEDDFNTLFTALKEIVEDLGEPDYSS